MTLSMKKLKIIIGCAALACGMIACDSLNEVVSTANDVINGGNTTTDGEEKPTLSSAEVIKGLKEALSKGTNVSSDGLSKLDGFWGNDRFRIPWPADAAKVREKALQWGLDEQVEKFELNLNRAAEDACVAAKPIFLAAITDMTIADGFAILKGSDNAATTYLKDKTSVQLKQTFKPKVQAAIDNVKLTEYWEPIINKYNNAMTLTGGEKLNPDLNEYVTDRAMTSLFTLIQDEEKSIRDNPVSRSTEILKKVFGWVFD
jgi:hypothetical protein